MARGCGGSGRWLAALMVACAGGAAGGALASDPAMPVTLDACVFDRAQDRFRAAGSADAATVRAQAAGRKSWFTQNSIIEIGGKTYRKYGMADQWTPAQLLSKEPILEGDKVGAMYDGAALILVDGACMFQPYVETMEYMVGIGEGVALVYHADRYVLMKPLNDGRIQTATVELSYVLSDLIDGVAYFTTREEVLCDPARNLQARYTYEYFRDDGTKVSGTTLPESEVYDYPDESPMKTVKNIACGFGDPQWEKLTKVRSHLWEAALHYRRTGSWPK